MKQLVHEGYPFFTKHLNGFGPDDHDDQQLARAESLGVKLNKCFHKPDTSR